MTRRDRESGGIGLLLLLPVVVAAAVVLLVGTAAATVLLAAGRAQDAADEAALTAVRATFAGDQRPCDAAATAVPRTSTPLLLVSCHRRDDGSIEVVVEAAVSSPLARGLGVGVRRARAAAAATAG